MPAALPPKTPLGRLIRDARESANLTQIDLADKLGVMQQTLSRWEAGIIMPPIDRLPALAAALHVDVNEFFAAAAESSGKTEAPTQTANRRLDQVEAQVADIQASLAAIADHLGLSKPAAKKQAGRRRQAPVQAARRKSR